MLFGPVWNTILFVEINDTHRKIFTYVEGFNHILISQKLNKLIFYRNFGDNLLRLIIVRLDLG